MGRWQTTLPGVRKRSYPTIGRRKPAQANRSRPASTATVRKGTAGTDGARPPTDRAARARRPEPDPQGSRPSSGHDRVALFPDGRKVLALQKLSRLYFDVVFDQMAVSVRLVT